MKKLKKILLITLMVLLFLTGSVLLIMRTSGHHRSNPEDIIHYETTNPLITGETAFMAHRIGAGIVPEESMMAMKYWVEHPEIHIDYYEFDLRMTADNQLVLFHNADLDKTTDAASVFGKEGLLVADMTVSELKKLNVGAKFVDENGNMPYANLKDIPDELRIVTLEEAFDYLTAAGIKHFCIEVKDNGELGMAGVDLLYNELKERDLLETTIFSSFKKDVSAYAAEKYPDMLRGNTDPQAIEFYLAAITNDKNYEPPCDVFQLPFNDKYLNLGINFGTAQVINFAHKHNVAIQYWVVDDPERMEYLESLGVDGIMTDYPNIMDETLGN